MRSMGWCQGQIWQPKDLFMSMLTGAMYKKKCWLNWDWPFDYKRDFVWAEPEQRTVLPSGWRHNASVYFDIECVNPTAESSSDSHLMPTVSDCNLRMNSSPKGANPVSSGKMQWNKKTIPFQATIWALAVEYLKHETICVMDHILLLWITRIRIQGVCLGHASPLWACLSPKPQGGATLLSFLSWIFREL